MDVVWFAEIKWNYLRTRKQHLVLRRPEGVEVTFFEPYVKGRDNRYELRSLDGIRAATIPLVKSVPGRGPLRALLDVGPVRGLVDAEALRRARRLLAHAHIDARATTFVVSNIYALHVVQALSPRRLVYDCNDAHSDFPGAPAWARAYRDGLFRAADAVVVSAERLRADAVAARGTDANVHVIGNGVDYAAFRRVAEERTAPALDEVRIGYLGAIAPWLDFDLIAALARSRPQWLFELVGPVVGGAQAELGGLLALPNVRHRPAVAHERVPDVLLDFSVGIIPFRKSELTAGVNPNKLYEYLAVGLPAVATPFSPEVARYARPADGAPAVVAVADDAAAWALACENFVAAKRGAATRAQVEARALAIAAAHDWSTIAAQFWRVVQNT